MSLFSHLRRTIVRAGLLMTALASVVSARTSEDQRCRHSCQRVAHSFAAPGGKIHHARTIAANGAGKQSDAGTGAAGTWSAYGRRLQACRRPNPTVGYVASEIGNDGKAGQQGVFVEQEFIRGNKLELSHDVASREQQQANKCWRCRRCAFRMRCEGSLCRPDRRAAARARP